MTKEAEICDVEPRSLPKFALYLFERRLTPFGVAREIGCSREHARRICLPLDDPDHRKPNARLRQKIASWTRGEIATCDWDCPAERGR